jgi:hypothetical protein
MPLLFRDNGAIAMEVGTKPIVPGGEPPGTIYTGTPHNLLE